MRRRAIVCLAGLSAICLYVVCMLWHGMQDAGDGFRKKQEECSVKWDAGQGMDQKTKQRVIQQTESEWVVTEDIQGSAMGHNLSYGGHYLLEEGDCLFVAGYDLSAGMELYGGEDAPEQEDYNIYRLKNGVWEVFISHPPESVEWVAEHYYWDETTIRNLVSYDGFLYYNLLYDNEPAMGGDKMQYVYRIPVSGGEEEGLALAYDTFCIYNGKIYYMGLEKKTRGNWEYVYWEIEPDGTNKREIYRRKREWKYSSFTVGGGCLYVEEADGNGITGVNLETGDMKYYSALWTSIEKFYYKNGYLYILNDDYYNGRNILCVDVVTGEKEQLTDNYASAWLEGRYLYYTGYDRAVEKWVISVLDLETKQTSTEALEESEGANTHLQTVGDDLVITISVKDRDVYYRYRADTPLLERLDRKEVLAENS